MAAAAALKDKLMWPINKEQKGERTHDEMVHQTATFVPYISTTKCLGLNLVFSFHNFL